MYSNLAYLAMLLLPLAIQMFSNSLLNGFLIVKNEGINYLIISLIGIGVVLLFGLIFYIIKKICSRRPPIDAIEHPALPAPPIIPRSQYRPTYVCDIEELPAIEMAFGPRQRADEHTKNNALMFKVAKSNSKV